jgi:hypothetical protein
MSASSVEVLTVLIYCRCLLKDHGKVEVAESSRASSHWGKKVLIVDAFVD